jgi:RNA polymerase sigma-70 factor (ECF subfamily)
MSRVPRESSGGRVEGFEALYRASFDDVTRFVARRVSAPADVADVVAASFAIAFDSWDRYDPAEAPAVAWLYGITRNVLARRARDKDYEQRLLSRIAPSSLLTSEDIEELEDLLDAVRLAPAVAQAVARVLTEHERDLFVLVHEDGLLIADAARVLGISPVAARMRLARARRRVRGALDAPAEPTPQSPLASRRHA